MNTINQQIYELGLIPVIKITDPAKAVPLARALCRGGLPAAEITFRTSCAAEAIAAITKECPEMLVLAGTVLNAEQADRAVAAGAKAIVSPGLNPNTVRHCQKIGVPIIPGTANPADVEAAIKGLPDAATIASGDAAAIQKVNAAAEAYTALSDVAKAQISPANVAAIVAAAQGASATRRPL